MKELDQAPARIDNQAIIEMSLLGAVSNLDQLRQVQEADPEWIAYGKVYEFIDKYSIDFNSIPSHQVISQQFAGWEPIEGEFEHWLAQYIRIRKYVQGLELNRKFSEWLEADPEDAFEQMATRIQDIGHNVKTFATAIDYTMFERVEAFANKTKELEENPDKIWGIPTGFRDIDVTRQGWTEGELVGIFARPTVGKTWMLIRQAVLSWLHGKTVLFISPEMNQQEIEQRWDTVLAGHLQVPFAHGHIQRGDPAMIRQYEALQQRKDEFGSRFDSNRRMWVIDQPLTLGKIGTMIQQYKADICLIDGVSLIDVKGFRGAEWEKMKQVIYDLKALATVHEIPIVITHQSVNKRRGRKADEDDNAQGRGDDWGMPTINDAAYGDAFVQACSTIITMTSDRRMANLKWYAIRKARNRGIDFKARCAMGWDINRGVMIDFSPYEQNEQQILEAMRHWKINAS